MSALPPDEPRPGDVVSGCTIARLLGRGAMGSAHLARRQEDDRVVVVKLLASDLAADPDLRARFLREWEALRKIGRHPNVVEVLALDARGARPALIMEHVDGVSLDEALKKHGRVPWARAARVARDLARGLAAVHARGIVHRDVKPANAMVTADGTAKLIDFGVAKDQARNTALTAPGQLVGTAAFMAPEVWEDQAADPPVDLFALGVTVYQLMAGTAPFVGRDVDEIAERVLSGEHAPLRVAVPDVPADLDAVVEHLLEPDRQLRYARASDCADDLDRVLAGQLPLLPTLLVEGAAAVRVALVGAEFFTLGSDAGCRLVLAHPSVAPKHAQVRREAATHALHDLKSPGGTWVGEAQVAPGAPRVLRDGDLVRLGQVALRFRDPRPECAGRA